MVDPQKSVKLRAWDVMMVALILFVAFTAPYQVGSGRRVKALVACWSGTVCAAAGSEVSSHWRGNEAAVDGN